MVLPKLVRLAAALAIGLFVLLCLQLSSKPITMKIPERIRGNWHDPMNDYIDEPPGPLHRAKDGNYDPDNAHSDRINATLLSLVRNEELDQMLQSMKELEETWNHKFNYPWTFFNDKPFTAEFKKKTRAATNAHCSYELIPPEHWETPPWIDNELYQESAKILTENGVQYAGKISYNHMCRWNSGLFQHHPALKNTQYYWRVEPNVHFFCDVDYDVFRWMRDHNKTYGFAINLYDSPESLPTLWPETERFIADPANAKYLAPGNAKAWLTESARRPDHNRKAGGYSTCHFWSNFEIGNLDFWRSPAYQAYFEHLDRAGGFFYERWGDAPVHSIALGLFEDSSRIHWFRDIGYNHIPFYNCPRRPGKCKGCVTGKMYDGEPFLLKEDCRMNWFKVAGLGEWERPTAENKGMRFARLGG